MTRKTKHQTQEDLARKCGVTQPFVSMVLSGSTRINLWETAKAFAAATDTTPELWLEGNPSDMRRAVYRDER